MRSVTGVYEVCSATIEEEWLPNHRSLPIRLYVDDELGKMWGEFDMGFCDGSLLCKNSPGSLKPDERSSSCDAAQRTTLGI